MNKERISLTVGSGGRTSYEFVNKEILGRFSNEMLDVLGDGANIGDGIVVTTDTFTVHPPFFEGGDIGKLAFCGMVNDLASMAAEPLYMTMGLVIEEGFPHADLTTILDSLKNNSAEHGVKLVAGDTKIVEKGKMEGIHIAMTGIGRRRLPYDLPSVTYDAGDRIIVTGPVGEHTLSVLRAKGAIEFEGTLPSDVAPLWHMVNAVISAGIVPKFIRDVTRGGLAAVLNELAITGAMRLAIQEENIPVNPQVRAICDIYGFDMYSLACEGRMIFVVAEDDAEKTVALLRNTQVASGASVIGSVTGRSKPLVVLETPYGGKTVLDMPLGENLPRIC